MPFLNNIDISVRSDLVRLAARKLVLICAVGFAALGLLVHFVPVLSFDVAISRELQETRAVNFEPVMAVVSVFGIPWIASASIISTAIAFLLFKRQREALFTLGVFLADGTNALLKLLIHRPRPDASLVEVMQKLTDPSFPSGHVVHYVVFFGFLYVMAHTIWNPSRRAQIWLAAIFFAIILAVAFSRVYLGAHWASDVVGGYLVGFTMLWVLLRLYFLGLPKPEDETAKL